MLENHFAAAAQWYAKNDYTKAAQEYDHVIHDAAATLADKVRAWNNTSACRAQLGDYQGALEAAQESLALDAQNSRALARAAAACEGMHRYDEAITYLEKMDKNDPGYDRHAATIARLRPLVHTSASPSGLARGSHRHPPDHTAQQQQQTQQQYFYYNKSIENAKTAMQAGNYIEAVRYYTKALDLFHTLHRRVTADDAANQATAEERVHHTLSSDKDRRATAREHAVLLCNRSSAYLRSGKPDAATQDAASATEVDGSYARAFYRLACAHQAMKQYVEAARAVQQCLALDPQHADAQHVLRCVEPLAQEQGKTLQEKAREHAQRVAEMTEKQREAVAAQSASNAFAAGPRTTAYASTYVYCNYCNETGHTRDECPLRRRKRMRN